MNASSPGDFTDLGRHVAVARKDRGWTQKTLAEHCGMPQSDIAKIELRERFPTLPQLARLARELLLPLQWFLDGRRRPGGDYQDIAIELQDLGIVDLFAPDARPPGAFRPPEEVAARAVAGDSPDPRLVEAIPTVLAWNSWNAHLLRAYARTADRRAPARLAWLADVALTIHRTYGFPGGFVEPTRLSAFVARAKPRPGQDSLGHPAAGDDELFPVSRRWHITYAADLETFHRRANHLLSLRADYLGRREPGGGPHA